MTLIVLKTGQVFWGMHLHWDLSAFLRVRLRLWFGGGRSEVKCHSHHVIAKGASHHHDLSQMLSSFTWLRQSLPRFSTVKSLSSLFSHCPPWKQVTKCGPHLRGRELCSTCPRVGNLHKLLGILYGRFLSSPSLIYSTVFISV